MTLAIFDLDNTLLTGDSDHGWGEFLVKKNLVDKAVYQKANEKFYNQYKQGKLDIHEYSEFSFKPLAEHSMVELANLHSVFMTEVINPMIGPKAVALVKNHQKQGHTLLVITATNSFITRPIVKAFGIEHILATEPKILNNQYVSEIDGIPCFQEGKVLRLKSWLKKNNKNLRGSFFYTDSHNDLPLLKIVDNPIAVDPDEKLRCVSLDKGWEIISLIS